MSHPLVVLNFGSSALASEADLPGAVHEIYRWVRRGWRVVAVVSAIGNSTNERRRRARPFGDRVNAYSAATLLALGEATSSALLSLALDRAGTPSIVLDETRLGLRTRGEVLNSEPCGLNVREVASSLERFPVVVTPGFVGRFDDGTVSLLGRGGSDLSAVFIAHRLQADRCRLIKDVDGIYEYDPVGCDPAPRRFRTLRWSEAVRVGGKVVQAKAVSFAESQRMPIEIAALNSEYPSLICDQAETFHAASAPGRPLRVALLGAGTVGLGVYRFLAAHPECFEITGIGVQQLEREDETPPRLLTRDLAKITASGCDVVIELIGGLQPARDLIRSALRAGKHVVTANKLVVSRHGRELERLASDSGAQLRYSAAVGGGVPMLEHVSQIARTKGITTVEGVVNGTTNFILDRLGEGLTYDEALREAQRLGFAEKDPTTDLDGSDAAHKLALLAQPAFGAWLDPEEVERTGISKVTEREVRAAAEHGEAVRLIARLRKTSGGLVATVSPRRVDREHAFAQTCNEENCLQIHSQDGEVVHVRGKGAGRWPTTESVAADLFDLHRAWQCGREAVPAAWRAS
jgi:homoserine dehydrogenase